MFPATLQVSLYGLKREGLILRAKLHTPKESAGAGGYKTEEIIEKAVQEKKKLRHSREIVNQLVIIC